MNYNDEDEEEVLFGTPFAPLQEEQTVSKRPEIDLTVRDSRGRRRFHGAFTGGFSAGFWNSVGSEEGFTPQQYVSNRKEKWDQTIVHSKPEDFMDSEDLDVFGIAPKRVRTKEKFAEQEFAGLRDNNASLIDVLKSVIKPTVESIGVKLYKTMKRNAKIDSNDENRLYGCEKPSEKVLNTDLPFFIYQPKSDFHGIGYKGINVENNSQELIDSSGVSATLSSGRKIKISGEAFGYGILDEDIDDEAVVYHKNDMSQYDFAIGTVRQKTHAIKNKSIDVLKSDTIDGFIKCNSKSILMESINKKYPIPLLPRDWRPSSSATVSKPKKSRWDESNAKESKTSESNVTASEITKPPVLNANIRAILLGEEVIHRQGLKQTKVEIIDKNSSHDVINENKKNASQMEPLFKKPLVGFWANKFTRSSTGSEGISLAGGLADFRSKESSERKKTEVEESENKITIERIIYEWHPHSLICKRFNIPNPYPQYPDVVGIVTVGKSDVRNRTSNLNTKKVKPNIFDCLFQDQNLVNDLKTDEPITAPNELEIDYNKSEETITKINQNDVTEESIRPAMDIFRAIFASDEEDSDNENVDQNDNNSEPITDSVSDVKNNNKKQMKSDSIQMNVTKSSGIFSNIDFDQLNRNFTPLLKSNEKDKQEVIDSKNDNNTNSNKLTDLKQSPDLYGPALPPQSNISDDNYINIYLNQTKSKSSKKKKKEKKHKKHKKHISHKKHKSYSSSSSDERVDDKLLNYLKSTKKL